MQISLTPEQEEVVRSRVASGRYSSMTEVIGEALRLLEDQEALRAQELAEFQEELQQRLDSLDRGEGISGEELEAYFRQKAALRRQQAA